MSGGEERGIFWNRPFDTSGRTGPNVGEVGLSMSGFHAQMRFFPEYTIQ